MLTNANTDRYQYHPIPLALVLVVLVLLHPHERENLQLIFSIRELGWVEKNRFELRIKYLEFF